MGHFCIIFFKAVLFSIYFSAHGTYLGHIRLEKKKPQHIPLDSEIHFGASTRIYIIRERPQPLTSQPLEDGKRTEEHDVSLLGLPESETELDVSSMNLENLNY